MGSVAPSFEGMLLTTAVNGFAGLKARAQPTALIGEFLPGSPLVDAIAIIGSIDLADGEAGR